MSLGRLTSRVKPAEVLLSIDEKFQGSSTLFNFDCGYKLKIHVILKAFLHREQCNSRFSSRGVSKTFNLLTPYFMP